MAKYAVRMTKQLIDKLEEPISELGISVRTGNTLNQEGIMTVLELLDCCGKRSCPCEKLHLLAIPNFGDKTLEELHDALTKSGFVQERVDE